MSRYSVIIYLSWLILYVILRLRRRIWLANPIYAANVNANSIARFFTSFRMTAFLMRYGVA